MHDFREKPQPRPAEKKIRFRMFGQFNEPPLRTYAGSRSRLDSHFARRFPADSLPDRLVRALGRQRVLAVKEVFESFEFFERVRKVLRAPVVADLCCGHGLTGLLFAIFERQVERVQLLDRALPPSQQVVFEAVREVAPWIEGKVEVHRRKLRAARPVLEPGTALVALHACGPRTDQVIDLALELEGPVAVLPCCYSEHRCPAPEAVRQALGRELAADVHRTYRLTEAGYHVRWSELPPEVTPMNRILMARKP